MIKADEPQERPPPLHRIGPALGSLLGWLLVAAVNAVFIARLPIAAPLVTRIAHHLYDLGHLLGLGLLSAASVALWCRRGPRPRWWARAALLLTAVILAVALLDNDSAGFVARRQAAGSRLPWRFLIAAAGALMVVAAAEVGRWCGRGSLRLAPVAVAMAVAAINNLILPFDYFGVHFFAAWGAAVLAGQALTTLPLPADLPRRLRRRGVRVAVGLLVVAAAGSILRVPDGRVRREISRTSGSVLLPVIATLLPRAGFRKAEPLPIARGPWFKPRSGQADRAPSQPPLLAAARERAPLIILITVDALRADVVAGDQHKALLPALIGLRDESVVFTQTRSAAPSTLASLFSVFTGKYYSSTFWSPRTDQAETTPFADSSPRLPAVLSQQGVRTVQVLALHGLSREGGVGMGFDEEIRAGKNYAPAAAVMDAALERLRQPTRGSLFMYMHFLDPHGPYTGVGKEGKPFDRYLRKVQLVDQQLARLRTSLGELGLADRTVVIVSADHGEAFGEHGATGHARTMYEELLRVPLLIHVPGIVHRRVDERVSSLDIGPTVLDLLGRTTPGHWLGESLVPALRGEDITARLTRPIAGDASRRMQSMIFPDGIKAIEDIAERTVELYDLRADPLEKNDLVDAQPDRADRYLSTMRLFFDVHAYKTGGYQPPRRRF